MAAGSSLNFDMMNLSAGKEKYRPFFYQPGIYTPIEVYVEEEPCIIHRYSQYTYPNIYSPFFTLAHDKNMFSVEVHNSSSNRNQSELDITKTNFNHSMYNLS